MRTGEQEMSGVVVLGQTHQALRDGSTELAVCWEARLLPRKECEGGGWYSVHPTEKAWQVRTWMRHKNPPGYAWDKVASCFHEQSDLEQAVERAIKPIRDRYIRSKAIQRGEHEGASDDAG